MQVGAGLVERDVAQLVDVHNVVAGELGELPGQPALLLRLDEHGDQLGRGHEPHPVVVLAAGHPQGDRQMRLPRADPADEHDVGGPRRRSGSRRPAGRRRGRGPAAPRTRRRPASSASGSGRPECGAGCGAPGVRSPPGAPAAPSSRPARDAGAPPARPGAATAPLPSTGAAPSGRRPSAEARQSRRPSASALRQRVIRRQRRGRHRDPRQLRTHLCDGRAHRRRTGLLLPEN